MKIYVACLGILTCLSGVVLSQLFVTQKLDWKSRLVAQNPDGPSTLKWSSDSRFVHISPIDERQNVEWGWCTLQADAIGATSPVKHFKSEITGQDKSNSRFEIVQTGNMKMALGLRSLITQKVISLEGTPDSRYGVEWFDSIQHWKRYQAERFSQDDRELSIVSGGAIYTWSTLSGKIIRKVQLTKPQLTNSFSFANYSTDGRYVIASLGPNSQKSVAGVFDARSGKCFLTISGRLERAFHCWFNPGSDFIHTLRFSEKDDTPEFSVWSLQQRKKLWSCKAESNYNITSIPTRHEVLIWDQKQISFHDEVTGEVRSTLNYPIQYTPEFIAPAPDASQIWASFSNGEIWAWTLPAPPQQ